MIGKHVQLTHSRAVGKYTGTTSDFGIIIACNTDDGSGVPGYSVKFDDGVVEDCIYFDEFEVIE